MLSQIERIASFAVVAAFVASKREFLVTVLLEADQALIMNCKKCNQKAQQISHKLEESEVGKQSQLIRL